MIPVLQVFRQALDIILERYSRFTLSLYLNNLKFLLKGMLSIALVTFLFVAGYESIADILDNHSGIYLERIPFLSEFHELFGALLILWIGYYAVARKEEQEVAGEEEELVGSKTGLREYRMLILPAVIILVVHGLAYTNPVKPLSGGIGGLFDQFVTPYNILGILDELIELGKNLILPVFLVMLMVIRGIWKELSGDLLREYRAAYIVSALLLFSLYAIFSSLFTFYKEVLTVISGELDLMYLWGNSLDDVLLLLAIGGGLLLLLGCFLPGFSMSMSLPLELEDELLEQDWHEREHNLPDQGSSDRITSIADQGGPIQ